jgi:hypothetical protein
MEALEQQALHPAQRVRLEMETRLGEHQVAHGNATSQQQWQTLLAAPGKLIALPPSLPTETPQAPGTAPTRHPLGAATQAGSVPQKPPQGAPFERVPHRDPVGTTRLEDRATKCSFVGHLPLAPAHLTASGVTRVECPECGALRTLNAQGSSLLFPSHPKRLTRPPRAEVRWVRRGSTWELFSPSIKEQE